jgi:zinc protease
MKPLRLAAQLLSMLVLSLVTFGGDKTQPLPKDMPPYGLLVPFRAPQVESKALDNGLTLWLVPRPGFPKVAFAFAVRGGMAADSNDRPGLSELLLATLDQGTRTRNARQIAEEIQAAGGDLSGNAQADALMLTTEVLAPKAEAALSVLADILRNATFPDDEVALAKRNAADNLRQHESEPSFLARRALAKALFGNHPYSMVAPTQDSIANTTAAELRQEYARRFRPKQTLLVAVGDFDARALTATARNLFGSWTGADGPAMAPLPDLPKTNPHTVFFVARPGSVQTTFAVASFAPTQRDPEYAATEVANAIYGGMFGSRLIKNIREDKGYTYSPGAFLQNHRETGVLQTRADVRNEVTGASLNEIDYELDRMATTSPAADEITSARRYLVGLKAIILQLQAAVASQLASLWVNGLPPEQLGGESEEIQKVTVKDVDAAGAKYFPAYRQTIVAVGEENVIRQQLAPFGLELQPAP